MSNDAKKRLQREFKGLLFNSIPGIVAAPKDGKLNVWECKIEVLDKDSVFFGREFMIETTFGKLYPFKPPKAKFKSQIFHPNICNKTGSICLDILKDNWSPAYNIRTVLISIQQLIDDANPDSPYNVDAAIVFRKGKKVFKLSVDKFFKDVEGETKKSPKKDKKESEK